MRLKHFMRHDSRYISYRIKSLLKLGKLYYKYDICWNRHIISDINYILGISHSNERYFAILIFGGKNPFL